MKALNNNEDPGEDQKISREAQMEINLFHRCLLTANAISLKYL